MIRIFIATFLALSAPAAADPLEAISSYLDSVTTLQADITQYSADGSLQAGRFMMRLPGRARIEYPDQDALVIIGGGQVGIFDGADDPSPQQFPLRKTPFAPFLAREIDLGDSDMVHGVFEEDGRINILVQDPDHPEYGFGQFIFSGDPVRMEAWLMTDGAGDTTRIEFANIEEGLELGSSLFSIPLLVARNAR